jgi:glycosyltransferase involved in cell wall biosynthesis
VPPPLAIALDATLWDEPTTGISQYARGLTPALEAEGVRVARLGAEHSGEAPRGRGVGRTAFTVGVLPELLAQRAEAIFHALGNFNLPLRRIPGKRFVLTVHDLIPELLPQTVSRAFYWQFRTWLTRSLTLADAVICVSQSTANDLAERHPGIRAPVHVVHHGVDHIRVPDRVEVETWFQTLGLPPFYVLYAGSLDARKNVGLVLKAMESLKAAGRALPLVLVGHQGFGAGATELRIERLSRQGIDIRRMGHLPAEQLHRLMEGAGAFVFPSRSEGFGLPPLEAMRLGAPTIVSRIPALAEICGDAALAVDPDDAEGLAAQIWRLRDAPDERRWWAEAAKRRAEQFTWQKAARATRDVYLDVSP